MWADLKTNTKNFSVFYQMNFRKHISRAKSTSRDEFENNIIQNEWYVLATFRLTCFCSHAVRVQFLARECRVPWASHVRFSKQKRGFPHLFRLFMFLRDVGSLKCPCFRQRKLLPLLFKKSNKNVCFTAITGRWLSKKRMKLQKKFIP